MQIRSSISWKFVAPAAILTFLLAYTQTGRAQPARGQARAVQTTIHGFLGSTVTTLADTGALSDSSDAREASQGDASVSAIFSGNALHATTIGWPDQVASEASVADVAVAIGGTAIGADFVMTRARAVQGGPASGGATLGGLFVNGVGIPVTGEPNQTVLIPGGRLVINEQQISAGGATVNGLHVVVEGIADVVIASASATLQ